MTRFASGKALVIFTKTEEDHWPEHHVYFQSMNMRSPTGDLEATYDCVQELFHCGTILGWFAVSKMKVGETWRVYVQFDAHGHRDYWGEYDEWLVINKWKILRKQKAKEPYQWK